MHRNLLSDMDGLITAMHLVDTAARALWLPGHAPHYVPTLQCEQCSACLVERGVLIGRSLLAGNGATLHGATRPTRCVLDMACDTLHTPPETMQVYR